MPAEEFKRHMRQTTLKEMTLKIGQDAYNIALQEEKRFRGTEI
jgi:hypothetical protein